MIFTNLNDCSQNRTFAQAIQECMEFTKGNDLNGYEPGSYEIPGKEIKFNIGSYITKHENEGLWESHLKYVDVQIMLDGSEYIAFNNVHNMEEESREIENDFIKHKGEIMFKVPIKNGDVLILYPEDAHMPGLVIGEPRQVKKVVFKIDVNNL